MFGAVIYVVDQRVLVIDPMAYYNHFPFRKLLGSWYIGTFITNLPVSKGFDAILTVVDRFTKMAHFLPCTKSITSQETADLLCGRYLSIMVYRMILLVIVVHNSSQSFGSTCLNFSTFRLSFLRAIIPKQMAKLSVPTKRWNNNKRILFQLSLFLSLSLSVLTVWTNLGFRWVVDLYL